MIDEKQVLVCLSMRIKDYRTYHNLTQRQLSVKAGLDPSGKTISRIEMWPNNFTPNLGTLIKIANVLDISLEELFRDF